MAEASISAAMRRRIVWASTIANALEWFDFVVFGLLATIIAKNFFPEDDPTAGLLATYGLFSVAFIARPLGAAFFGTWTLLRTSPMALVSDSIPIGGWEMSRCLGSLVFSRSMNV